MVKIGEIYQMLDGFAPKVLSDAYCEKFGKYDNSGILIDTGDEIKGVLFSLDLSLGAIQTAKEKGANLICTHHPAIFHGIKKIDVNDSYERKIAECIKLGISVLSMHINLDMAQGGIDEWLYLGLSKCAFSPLGGLDEPKILETVEIGGKLGEYGRCFSVSEISLTALLEECKKEFGWKNLCVFENGQKPIKKIGSFCGSGCDEDTVRFCVQNGADLIVSADIERHVLSYALENGIAVVMPTHYGTETYGFKKFYERIRERLAIPCHFWQDEMML